MWPGQISLWIMNWRNRCKCPGRNPSGWAYSPTRKNKSEDDGMTRNVLRTKSSNWSRSDTLALCRSRGVRLCACLEALLSSSEQLAKHLECIEVEHLLFRFSYSLKHYIGTVYYLWLKHPSVNTQKNNNWWLYAFSLFSALDALLCSTLSQYLKLSVSASFVKPPFGITRRPANLFLSHCGCFACGIIAVFPSERATW